MCCYPTLLSNLYSVRPQHQTNIRRLEVNINSIKPSCFDKISSHFDDGQLQNLQNLALMSMERTADWAKGTGPWRPIFPGTETSMYVSYFHFLISSSLYIGSAYYYSCTYAALHPSPFMHLPAYVYSGSQQHSQSVSQSVSFNELNWLEFQL